MASKRLIVVVPGIRKGLAPWAPLLAKLKQAARSPESDTRWLELEHGGGPFSTKRAYDLALNLCASVDAQWQFEGPFDEVLLMGHSAGGVLLRQAYLIASGAGGKGARKLPWSAAVSRFVLLASVNRGLASVDVRGPRPWKRLLKLLGFLFRILPFLQGLLAADFMRGSPFLTNMRISWIRHFDGLEHPPTVVQLLGAEDGVVAREDSIDIEQLGNGWHVMVPNSGHRDLHWIDDSEVGRVRYQRIRAALFDAEPAGGENVAPARGPRRIVFLLHGIKSSSTAWAEPLAKLIHEATGGSDDCLVIPASYGYFTALQFALPTTRRKHLRWFADQYAQMLALNPSAKFMFVGHSNGTYLFGESLKELPAMRFERAVLVGSVLPRDYNWEERVRQNQVGTLCNLRSSRDVPVAFLCSAMRGLRMLDVGTAGFEGFLYADPRVKEEIYWFDGGHSRPLESEHLPHVVHHLFRDPSQPSVDQRTCDKDRCRLVEKVPFHYSLVSRFAPALAQVVAISGLVLAALAIYRGQLSWTLGALVVLFVAFVVRDVL